MTSIRPTIFLDFDGTITIRDATDAILEAYADPHWLQIEEAWKAGRMGSRDCLTAQMALVSASRQQVDALLDAIEIDPGFVTLIELAAARALPVQIVSDGFDYCIDRILRRPSLRLAAYLGAMRIVSSHLETDDTRWYASFTSPVTSCVHGCATCKPAVMARLNESGAPAIFVGDGLSDWYAAAASDLVFAKDSLAAYCTEMSVPYTPYDNLTTVARRIEELLQSDTAAERALSGKVFPAT